MWPLITQFSGPDEQLAGLGHELVYLCLALIPQRDGDVDDVAHMAQRHQRRVHEKSEQVPFLVLVCGNIHWSRCCYQCEAQTCMSQCSSM